MRCGLSLERLLRRQGQAEQGRQVLAEAVAGFDDDAVHPDLSQARGRLVHATLVGN